jgi:hypothetical protein
LPCERGGQVHLASTDADPQRARGGKRVPQPSLEDIFQLLCSPRGVATPLGDDQRLDLRTRLVRDMLGCT